MYSSIDWYIETFGKFYENTVFFYGVTLLIIYGILGFLSLRSIKSFLAEEAKTDYKMLLSSHITPGISVIAPAFNEGVTIITNVKSLLNLNYPTYEVIVINDGSTDDTLPKLIHEFQLEEIEFAYIEKIKTQPVRGIYKSKNKAYAKLLVIDKVNGKSKADASNAGINASSFPYFLCTDVDCVLDQDTLMKLIRPVLVEPKRRIIASGATLRMVNSCEVERGVIRRVRPPKQLLPRFQEVEYIRSFVLGKMGWNRINCVPNVSGGLGMFDKEIVVKSGGYDPLSSGEDMELTWRMIRYCRDNKIKYAVKYIPVTLCWTEGPTSIKIFKRQRVRWARGLSQLIFAHSKMLLNPRYGRMGLIVAPYNFFFELVAPFIEALGVLYYILLAVLGLINWPFAIILLIFVFTYAIMITTVAILWDQITFKYYRSWTEVLGLCIMPFFEMFIYHPLIVIFSIQGTIQFITNKKHSWGNMQRRGFTQVSEAKAA